MVLGAAHRVTKGRQAGHRPQPYLDTCAHLTAFHERDQAFAIHPQDQVNGDHGGPDLPFHAELPKSGKWRLFLRFQAQGALHTAAITVHAS